MTEGYVTCGALSDAEHIDSILQKDTLQLGRY